jgi:hypothetical protein
MLCLYLKAIKILRRKKEKKKWKLGNEIYARGAKLQAAEEENSGDGVRGDGKAVDVRKEPHRLEDRCQVGAADRPPVSGPGAPY